MRVRFAPRRRTAARAAAAAAVLALLSGVGLYLRIESDARRPTAPILP